MAALTVESSEKLNLSDLEGILAALGADYSKLSPRIRMMQHTVQCECEGVTLRLHYPAFRQGQATVFELVDAIIHYLPAFSLPRSEREVVRAQYGKIDEAEFSLKMSQLFQSAVDLFKRAQKAGNRNGESGELLLYLLTEWVLQAPQIIAKMSLKTNKEMPVHGSDGVHVRYCESTSKLILYWGESKLYADVGTAIKAAVTSITDALKPDKMKHEIDLVKRNIDFAGLSTDAKRAVLQFLDPYTEEYNERKDVTTCLIGFDFDGFKQITAADADAAETKFQELATAKLTEIAAKTANALKAANLADRPIEIFFFPVPSVQELRDFFQSKIGWKE